ncbi:hypothetical protein BDF20DRAFT_810930 [Mycotypha africana]|uniref:uncharacterized protein n=1 Tax=Mycotypha africana TaxID=64632 RepID=UPI00230043BB|nr:uncharacterized protein BDF20DRAFT_810930 [Mycotypha africana]KAI8992107.1 hypothetical protein BDF20DRAFT_810930 [Mycotypha africana]
MSTQPLLPADISAIPTANNDPNRYLTIQAHDIVIPSYASWFDFKNIHPNEIRSLPEFFNDRNKSKNPTTYRTYRDFMINTYRMNPVEYLSITACRRNLTGDVCAILRVHSFLEQWGLINYQVDHDSKPSSVSPPFDSQFKVVIMKEEEPTEPEESEQQVKDNNKGNGNQIDEKIKEEVEKPVIKTYNFDKEKKPEKCSSCGSECKAEQFCSTTQPNFYLCRQCYLEGKYPSTQSPRSEVKEEEQSIEEDEEKWTKEEETLLKEGLVKFYNDWSRISDYVGTRTPDECLLHFLKLPYNDPIHDIEIEKLGLISYSSLNYDRNPIMSGIAFLASTVQPEVAAAAADIEMVNIKKEEEGKTKKENYTTEMHISEGKSDVDHKDESKANETEEQPTMSMNDDKHLCNLTATLFGQKLESYKQRVLNFEKLEIIVEEQKRRFEKEQRQIGLEQISFKQKITSIYQKITERGNSATIIANSITPAQLQQQMVAGTNPAMLLNSQQASVSPHHHQRQQQQQSPQALQQQLMQLQQQKAQHLQQRQHQHSPMHANDTVYNNLMDL